MTWGVEAKLVTRASKHLLETGLIHESGTLGRNWSTGHIWISAEGVSAVEASALPIEAFLQGVFSSALTRIGAIDPELGSVFDDLRAAAGNAAGTPNELVGFAARVRDFVERLTERLCEVHKVEGVFDRNRTINKVRALTARSASEKQTEYVRALAEVVETHWKGLNGIQQKGVHAGLIESQRLFAYTVLFTADPLDLLG